VRAITLSCRILKIEFDNNIQGVPVAEIPLRYITPQQKSSIHFDYAAGQSTKGLTL
jgi:hypothetical protein